MKQVFPLFALLFTFGPAAFAVDLNKDALKEMQKEGHKIVEESQGGRNYKTANGLCLDIANGALVVKKCNKKSASQMWSMDDKNRLVAHDRKCVNGSRLQKCGSGKAQKWKLDGKKRLANQAQKCLQVKGNPPKGGAAVTAEKCSGAKNQAWQ